MNCEASQWGYMDFINVQWFFVTIGLPHFISIVTFNTALLQLISLKINQLKVIIIFTLHDYVVVTINVILI